MSIFKSLFGSKKETTPTTSVPSVNRYDSLEKLAKAREQYKQDNDINKLISVYEEFFVSSNPPMKSPDEFELAKLYEKAGDTNKAWSYLNAILLRGNTPPYLIYNEQATILKKENKYEDAIHTYMLCYQTKVGLLGKDAWEEKFRKDVGICVRKLKWDENAIDTLANMIKAHITKGDLETCDISAEFKTFYEGIK